MAADQNNFTHQVDQAFREVMSRFNASPAIQVLNSDEFRVEHYCSALREFYHYVKENPQLQTLQAVYFRGSDRELVKAFCGHARSETGHEHMALDDYSTLGGDRHAVIRENPLPDTIALTGFAFFQIQYRNPVGHLGYSYFLEHMPTEYGPVYAAALSRANVSESAMTFLKEHISVDVGHNRLMDEYMRRLIRSQADVDAVIYTMRVTGHLYANMLWSAIRRADDKTLQYGRNQIETDRLTAK